MLGKIDKYINFLGFKVQGDIGPITCYTSKKGKIVWYLKAPPKEPPSEHQTMNRIAWAESAIMWRMLDPEERTVWKEIARRANLRITGFNLFTYYQMTKDIRPIITACDKAEMSLLIGATL